MKEKKVLIKVWDEYSVKWIHFCYVRTDIYEEFFRVTGLEKSEFGAFLSECAYNDFNVKIQVSSYEDLMKLRRIVCLGYLDKLPELKYCNSPGTLIKAWVSKCMVNQIYKRKDEKNAQ